MAHTKHGKEYATTMLELRRKGFANQIHVDNSSLIAGSPMVYYCLACDAPIWVPEGWLAKPDLCAECQAMQMLGWLE